MRAVSNITKTSHCSSLFLLNILTLLFHISCIEYHSNFNSSKTNPIASGDPISLPIILHSSENKQHQFPYQSPTHLSSSNQEPASPGYRLKRYELKDTKYKPQQHDLNEIQQSIIYGMQPPPSIFDVGRSITFEDYQLLEMKNIRMMMINPTNKFKFCINEIYMDSEAVKRIEHRKLPFCLNPNNKYPFFFNLFISQQKPIIFRTSVYFIISIYDGKELVDEKIWPRQIIAKVSQNHLRLGPIEAKNCGNPKNFTTLTIPNPHPHHIKVSFDNEVQMQKQVQKQVMIPSQKNFKTPIASKQSVIGISTRPYEGSLSQSKYPKIYLPVYCVKPLEINYFNIGVLNTDRSVVEILVPVSSNSKQAIQIKTIEVISSTETVEVVPLTDAEEKVRPGGQHVGLFRLMAHIPKQQSQKTTIDIRILYYLQSSPKQILQAKTQLKFYELKNPLSLEGRRFIDVTKPEDPDPVMSNIFPIRNNLNLPLLLVRVIFDQKVFKLTWLKDRRQYIYPNQKRDEFSLQYIGPRQLKISPVKYIMMLQFNGNLFIPIQIVVYDHSLQCVFNNIQQKCHNLGMIDYGYFRTNGTKFKQIVIRNWNPIQKQIKIKLIQNLIQNFGMNITMNIFGPFPSYQIMSKHVNNTLFFYLKGNHFIIVNLGITPLRNSTSGQTVFQIHTDSEKIVKKLKFKVENGTIALIPQTLRINSVYQKTVQYLNLVSTFSQPYKIKSTFVNNSHISIYFNNHSQIYQNQWIGLALVYQPFPTASTPTSSTPSYVVSQSTNPTSSQLQNNRHNEICCGNQFFLNSFIIPHHNNQYKRFTYVSVRVVTTTQLEATSTIIIDNTPPKLVGEENFTISLINYQGRDVGGVEGGEKMQEGENRDYRIKVKNVFKQYVKYKPVIIPRSLYQDTKQYLQTMKHTLKHPQQSLLCLNNHLTIKHNLSPQLIKSLFSLQQTPQQLTIEPLQNQQYYIGSQTHRYTSELPSLLTEYVRKSVEDGARICYKINSTKYIKQLIETYIINDIADLYQSQVFYLFVEKEVEYYRGWQMGLEAEEFYDGVAVDFGRYCNKSVYPLFRFCKQIGVVIGPTSQTILQPAAQAQIVVRASSRVREASQQFYLVLLNNITRYEVHLINISITQPKLQILKTHPFPSLQKKHLSRLLKQSSPSSQQLTSELAKLPSNTIILQTSSSAPLQPQTFTITLHNPSTITLNITHIGFEKNQILCQYHNIQIVRDVCKGFVIRSGQSFNVSVVVDRDGGNWDRAVKMFLYCEGGFYFRIMVFVVREGDLGVNGHRVVSTFALNTLSLLFLVLVIWRFKQEIDEKEAEKKQNRKRKLMNPSSYSNLGTRIERKTRRLQPITEQQIQAVKQIQQKRIKQFFNSSGESEIAKRQHTEQQQPSNIHILNVLKTDKNNMSASQQSSLDFIDIQALNKSTLGEQADRQQDMEGSGYVDEEPGEVGDADIKNVGEEQEVSGSNEIESQGSDADSNFTEGDVADFSAKTEQKIKDYGWGDPSQQRKKQQQGNSYYNVFFSQNPLKKKQSTGLFPWMNEHQRTHHHR